MPKVSSTSNILLSNADGDAAVVTKVTLPASVLSLARPWLVSTVAKKGEPSINRIDGIQAWLISDSHAKVDCPKPRVFKGTCRVCNKEGHPAAECPERPPEICKNCQMEGHKTLDCAGNRKFDLNNIPDKLPEEAWALLKQASDDKDFDDFREGLKIYSKAVPEATYLDIEKRMREENFYFYLIALEREVDINFTLINLQGKLNCKYCVGLYNKPKPQRAYLKDRWPVSVEENLERLADAGLPHDRLVPLCRICNGEQSNGSHLVSLPLTR
ncbi:hypothetical protein BDV59DRAFT_113385 [Aspergillus ambiguus]|uniref:putative zinc knuckle transcription factor (CnjB) n=1 Tax=Aspergillus ambiguus TaxID=176160 RepID=UPI003CCE39E1